MFNKEKRVEWKGKPFDRGDKMAELRPKKIYQLVGLGQIFAPKACFFEPKLDRFKFWTHKSFS